MNLIEKIGINKLIVINLIISIFTLGFAMYNYSYIQEVEKYAETIEMSERHIKLSEIKELLDEMKKEKTNLLKAIKKAQINYAELDAELRYLKSVVQNSVKIKRENIIFSKQLEEALKKLNPPKREEKSIEKTGRKTLYIPAQTSQANNDKKTGKEDKPKKEKKKKRIVKYHIKIPKLFIAKKVSLIAGEHYLYLADGTIITKGSYYPDNRFRIECVNPNGSYVLLKVIDPTTFENNKVFKVPYQLKIETIQKDTNKNTNQTNTNNGQNNNFPNMNGPVLISQ